MEVVQAQRVVRTMNLSVEFGLGALAERGVTFSVLGTAPILFGPGEEVATNTSERFSEESQEERDDGGDSESDDQQGVEDDRQVVGKPPLLYITNRRSSWWQRF